MEEAEQEPDVQAHLASIREEYKTLKPEEILCIDPCSGSGHILAYMFDVLVQIYAAYGVDTRTAVASIVENNIYGLDIDDRAAQLAYFSVMMKACQYDKRFLRRKVQPHVYAIVESNRVDRYAVEYFCNGDAKLKVAMDTIIEELHDAKEYGSIITVSQQDWDAMYARFDEIQNEKVMSIYTDVALKLKPMIQVAEILSRKYLVVSTNPPYMGASGMSPKLVEYVKDNYSDSKSDLFAVFIEVCERLLKANGFQAMITQHAWMFLPSYEKLRNSLQNVNIVSMIHLGARAFEEIAGEVVQTTSFVLRKLHMNRYRGSYTRLTEFTSQQSKEDAFLEKNNQYIANQNDYVKIPGGPIAYWVSASVIRCYVNKNVYSYANPCKGIDTGDNSAFLRMWFEVDTNKRFIPRGVAVTSDDFKRFKWFPYNKGGSYRKWYGNNEYVLNWENNGTKLKNFKGSNLRNKMYYFQEGVTWSTVSSTKNSFRYFPQGFLFDNGGSCLFCNSKLKYIQALLNSEVSIELLKIQPTMNSQPGTIGSILLLIS